MNTTIPRQENPNLQQLCMNAVAASIWKQNDVKTKVKNFFTSEWDFLDKVASNLSDTINCQLIYSPERIKLETRWYSFTMDLCKELDSLRLPTLLRSELIFVLRGLSLQILDFVICIKHDLKRLMRSELLTCIDEICWTGNYVIDYVKTFKTTWIKKHTVNVNRIRSEGLSFVSMSSVEKSIFKEFKALYKKYGSWSFEYHIATYSDCYRNGYLPNLMAEIRQLIVRKSFAQDDEYLSIEETMFRYSIRHGFAKAVKHFWNEIDFEERRRNLTYIKMILSRYHNSKAVLKYYRGNQFLEMYMFLISLIPNDQLKEFFTKSQIFSKDPCQHFFRHLCDRNYFVKLVLSWPWHLVFVQLLDLMWSFNVEINIMLIFDVIILQMKQESVMCSIFQNIMHYYPQIFRAVWHKVPANSKKSLTECEFRVLRGHLIDVGDAESVRLISHDQEIMINRNLHATDCVLKCRNLAVGNKFERINDIIEALSVSDENVSLIKSQISEVDIVQSILSRWKMSHLLKGNRFCTLDNYLKWKSDSLEESYQLKEHIDVLQVYELLLSNSAYELFDDFLNWRFESVDDIEIFKNNMKFHQLTSDFVINCLRDKKEGKMKLQSFLSWLFKSEDEILHAWTVKFMHDAIPLFKELFDSNIDSSYNKKHSDLESPLQKILEKIDNMLNRCALSHEKLKDLKRLLFEKLFIEICCDYVKEGEVEDLQDIVKWGFESEDEVKDFMIEFLMTGTRPKDLTSNSRYLTFKYTLFSGKCFEPGYWNEDDYRFDDFLKTYVMPLENVSEVPRKYKHNEYMMCSAVQLQKNKILINTMIKSIRSYAQSNTKTKEENL